MATLTDLQKQCWEDSLLYFPEMVHKSRWDYWALCLAGEVGEACNLIKKHMRGSIRPSAVAVELAKELPDILIYLLMLAEDLNIDLEEAYEIKREFNNARYLGHTDDSQ